MIRIEGWKEDDLSEEQYAAINHFINFFQVRYPNIDSLSSFYVNN
jgi:hypothetical protein